MKAHRFLIPLGVIALYLAATSTTGLTSRKPARLESPDKLQVISFESDPAKPECGKQARLRMRVKNVGGVRLPRVSWGFRYEGAAFNFESGSKENVGIGETFDVEGVWQGGPPTATWLVGSVKLLPELAGGPTEPESERANNSMRIKIFLGPMVTDALYHPKARQVGATFEMQGQEASNCVSEMIVQTPPTDQVGFRARCSNNGRPVLFEFFKNFKLSNGWKVKSVEVVRDQKTGGANWRWEVQPTPGTDNPYMRLRVWSDAPGTVEVLVRVTIEGLACDKRGPYCHQNPYQNCIN